MLRPLPPPPSLPAPLLRPIPADAPPPPRHTVPALPSAVGHAVLRASSVSRAGHLLTTVATSRLDLSTLLSLDCEP